MKVGIDSYCYHRFFGEVYPQQSEPPSRMILEEFIDRARALEVDGLSLESCFIDGKDDAGYLESVNARLDGYGLDRRAAIARPGDARHRGSPATAECATVFGRLELLSGNPD